MTDQFCDEGPSRLFFAIRPDSDTSRPATPRSELPPLFITSRDHRRLRALVDASRHKANASVVRFLVAELDRAAIYRPDMIPPGVVTMNSRVFFRPDLNCPLESRTLVYEDDYAVLGGTVSVLTPLGSALIGLREHSAMPYVSLDGTRRMLVVERVAYQPEGEGRLMRAPYRYWPKAHRDHKDVDRQQPNPGRDDSDRTVVPLRPRPQPRPAAPDDDDPGPGRAA